MALTGYQYKEQGPTSYLAEQRDEDLQGGKDAKDIKQHQQAILQNNVLKIFKKAKTQKISRQQPKKRYACGHT